MLLYVMMGNIGLRGDEDYPLPFGGKNIDSPGASLLPDRFQSIVTVRLRPR
jgi:hypothetical protein